MGGEREKIRVKGRYRKARGQKQKGRKKVREKKRDFVRGRKVERKGDGRKRQRAGGVCVDREGRRKVNIHTVRGGGELTRW